MNYRQIKILLLEKKINVGELAEAIKEHRGAVSQTITYVRKNMRIRLKICAYFGMEYSEIWDDSIRCGPVTAPQVRSAEAA
ncbi:MAG: hypothetical protein WBV94_03955 [Blastocatellia bacterium]